MLYYNFFFGNKLSEYIETEKKEHQWLICLKEEKERSFTA
jgi:hypothetical protein